MADEGSGRKVPSPADEPWQARMLERLGIGTFRINHVTGTFEAANEPLARILGFPSAAAVVGEPASGNYEDAEERAESTSRVYNHPAVVAQGFLRAEVQRKRRDTGELVDVLLSLALYRNEANEVVQVDGLLEDIGERKKAEKAYRSGAERFKVIFETSPVGMALASPDGVMWRINGALCRFLGATGETCRGSSFADYAHPEDRSEVGRVFRREEAGTDLEGIPRTGEAPEQEQAASPFEWRFERPDGSLVWGRCRVFWLTEGKVSHSRVIMVEDITHHKAMEENLLRIEKLNAIGLLAGGLAHDFNNILAIVMGNVALARSTDDPDAVAGHLEAVERACSRARGLTNQLITFARGGQPLRTPTDLALQAGAAAELCLKGTEMQARLDVEPGLLAADVDHGQIAQVFQNLLLNARDASHAEGTVTVALRNLQVTEAESEFLPPGRYVQVTVSDQGPGIGPGDLGRIFDPYFTTKPGGTGLGLASVYSIIRNHGGSIEAESPPGGGALFRFAVPATERTPRAGEDDDWPLVVARRTGPGARILVMDDNRPVREVLVGILERAGYEVVATANGREALERFHEGRKAGQPFNLAILDLMVHRGMGGLETLRALRANNEELKAIVCSGYSSDPVMADYESHGFQGVVPKPFSASALLDAVRSTLDA